MISTFYVYSISPSSPAFLLLHLPLLQFLVASFSDGEPIDFFTHCKCTRYSRVSISCSRRSFLLRDDPPAGSSPYNILLVLMMGWRCCGLDQNLAYNYCFFCLVSWFLSWFLFSPLSWSLSSCELACCLLPVFLLLFFSPAGSPWRVLLEKKNLQSQSQSDSQRSVSPGLPALPDLSTPTKATTTTTTTTTMTMTTTTATTSQMQTQTQQPKDQGPIVILAPSPRRASETRKRPELLLDVDFGREGNEGGKEMMEMGRNVSYRFEARSENLVTYFGRRRRWEEDLVERKRKDKNVERYSCGLMLTLCTQSGVGVEFKGSFKGLPELGH
ncbi:hypothetical protein K435DRAFT_928506 [Dendrothele bispora CBS 962.96]|uniref:Uncharacterized protein n=1 Tax=Dendrothele bispora (strain CBS 962.96) TaxID=1314807 RepID=A0A4S8L7Z2_DENBC|nr:hypothetical protein K435DRAFT_928506 [Dendrothele bispora CBS 962.96]